MNVKSKFAILDVGHGRKALAKMVGGFSGGGDINVVIYGKITHQWGHDDGESIEFAVNVEKVEVQ